MITHFAGLSKVGGKYLFQNDKVNVIQLCCFLKQDSQLCALLLLKCYHYFFNPDQVKCHRFFFFLFNLAEKLIAKYDRKK